MRKETSKAPRLQFWKIIMYGFAAFALLLIFSAYFAPDMMVAMTNQVWALCGW
jgi:uncharacterized membrane protein YhaH (DUF805 family)